MPVEGNQGVDRNMGGADKWHSMNTGSKASMASKATAFGFAATLTLIAPQSVLVTVPLMIFTARSLKKDVEVYREKKFNAKANVADTTQLNKVRAAAGGNFGHNLKVDNLASKDVAIQNKSGEKSTFTLTHGQVLNLLRIDDASFKNLDDSSINSDQSQDTFDFELAQKRIDSIHQECGSDLTLAKTVVMLLSNRNNVLGFQIDADKSKIDQDSDHVVFRISVADAGGYRRIDEFTMHDIQYADEFKTY